MKRIALIAAIGAAVAGAIGYFGVMAVAPGYIMGRAWDGIVERTGAVNRMVHLPLTMGVRRGIVRPSPDLLYSVCAFDLTEGNLSIAVPAVADHYWSLTIFDADTDAVFVRSDRDTGGKPIRLNVAYGSALMETETKLVLPDAKGIALVRILLKDRGQIAEIDPIRRAGACSLIS